MVFVDLNMELHAAPIAKLGARKMEGYRLPFCAVIALWLLTVQVIALVHAPAKRNVVIKDATHFVLFEKNRTQFFEEILKFMKE